MPAIVLSEDSVQSRLPKDAMQLFVRRMTKWTGLENVYMKGVIIKKYNLYMKPYPAIKFLLKDSTGTTDMYGVGQTAIDLNTKCKEKDTVYCMRFRVEKAPLHQSVPYQVVADDRESKGSLVWVVRANGRTAKTDEHAVSSSTAIKQSNAESTKMSAALPSPDRARVDKAQASTSRSDQDVVPSNAGPSNTKSPKKTFSSPNIAKIQNKKFAKYNYKPLAELKVGTMEDVYGVVKFIRDPVRTRGKDYHLLLSIQDPSLGSNDKLTCNIFAKDRDKLPKAEIGDVIRIHRLSIQSHCGKLQGCSGPGFHWLVFQGSPDKIISSSLNYTLEAQDKEKVKSLFYWWENDGELSSSAASFTKLSNVRPRQYFNLICQVVRICDLKTPDASPCKLLRVWDGTKFEGPIKEAAEQDFSGESLKENDSLMKASASTAHDIYIFDNHVAETASVQPGQFIKLTNLHAAVVNGQVELTLHGGTHFNRGIEVLPTDSTVISTLKVELEALVDMMDLNFSETMSLDVSHKALDSTRVNVSSSDEEEGGSGGKRRKVSSKGKGRGKRTVLKLGDQEIDGPGRNKSNNNSIRSGELEESVRKKHKQSRSETQDKDLHSQVNVDSDDSQSSGSFEVITSLDHRGIENSNVQDETITSSGGASCQQEGEPNEEKHLGNKDRDEENVASSQDSFATACSLQSLQQAQEMEDTVLKTDIQSTNSSGSPRVQLTLKGLCDKMTDMNPEEKECSPIFIKNLSLDSITFENNEPLTLADMSQSQAPFIYLDSSPNVVPDSEHPLSQPALLSQPRHLTQSGEAKTSIHQNPDCDSEDLVKVTAITGHRSVPFSSLEDVMKTKAPAIFKVRLKVKDYLPHPTQARDLFRLYCSNCDYFTSASSSDDHQEDDLYIQNCPRCTEPSRKLDLTPLLGFSLCDDTNSIVAFIWENNAMQFLENWDPFALLTDKDQFEEVQEALSTLCPLHLPLEQRPIMECCIISHRVANKVSFHIFDTILLKPTTD